MIATSNLEVAKILQFAQDYKIVFPTPNIPDHDMRDEVDIVIEVYEHLVGKLGFMTFGGIQLNYDYRVWMFDGRRGSVAILVEEQYISVLLRQSDIEDEAISDHSKIHSQLFTEIDNWW